MEGPRTRPWVAPNRRSRGRRLCKDEAVTPNWASRSKQTAAARDCGSAPADRHTYSPSGTQQCPFCFCPFPCCFIPALHFTSSLLFPLTLLLLLRFFRLSNPVADSAFDRDQKTHRRADAPVLYTSSHLIVSRFPILRLLLSH